MSSTKILNVQIINAHDTESNWKQIENDFVPSDGEMIVYSPDATHTNSRIKIGNGKDNLAKLNFFTGNIIKTKTAPGANNTNTQNIYQVVDNNDEVVGYWYYSDGEWCELGSNNVDLSGKADVDHSHGELKITAEDDAIVSFNIDKEHTLWAPIEGVSLSSDAAYNYTRYIHPSTDEEGNPVWSIGSEYARFKSIYVDGVYSKAGEDWTVSLTPIMTAWGPGFSCSHMLKTNTIQLSDSIGETPGIMATTNFGYASLRLWTDSPWVTDDGYLGWQVDGDFSCRNINVDNYITTNYIHANYEVIAPSIHTGFAGISGSTVSAPFFEIVADDKFSTHLSSTINEGTGETFLHIDADKLVVSDIASRAIDATTMRADEITEGDQTLESKYALKGEASKSMVNITHSDLVSLRDSASLVPGQFYRITDYQCRTTQENTSSAGHKFDIIVRADSESVLNESAWATYHYNEDGSVDGYFQKQIKTIVSASFKDGVDISDAGIVFTQSFDDSYWKPSDEWSEMNYLTTHEHPEWGVEVPAIYDPDPEDGGYNVIFIYEDSIARPVGNKLASIEAIMDPTGQEVLYTGSHNLSEFEDVLVYFDYQDNTPVMRKTEAFIYKNADMEELLVYNGDFTLDGIVYNQWNKLEGGGESYKILTNKIVENGQFIYSLEELQNAIIYETLDKWSEYEASTMRCNGYYRYTHNVVDAEFNEAFSVKRANPSAWELKYCLDNDENRFYWADVENGRGVVYYMKDEYNNECGYDFKNILFEDRYTFNWHESNPLDLSIVGNSGELVNDEGTSGGVCNNIIKPCFEANTQRLNNIVFDEDPGWDSGLFYGCSNNTFEYNCSNIYFSNGCSNNSFESNCMNFTFAESCSNNSFGSYCTGCTFEECCCDNSFGSYCADNTFAVNCSGNIFENSCYRNVVGSNSCFNHLGVNCDYTIIEEDCRYNRFIETSLVCLRERSVNSIVEYVQGSDNRLTYVENPSEALAIIRPRNVREVLV